MFVTNVSKRKSHLSIIKRILTDHAEIVLCSGWMKACGLREILPFIDDALARNASVLVFTNAEHTQPACVTLLRERQKLVHVNVKAPYLHTKLYYGRSEDNFLAMVGSANITSGGLWKNEELSQVSQGKVGDAAHAQLLSYLKTLTGFIHAGI